MSEKIKIETDQYIITSEDANVEINAVSSYVEVKIIIYKGQVIQKGKDVKIPELYQENLEALKNALDEFSGLGLEGLHDLELRVKIDDVDTWAVIGYGELGDPCILRFEQ